MYRRRGTPQNQPGTYRSDDQLLLRTQGKWGAARDTEKGGPLGPRTRNIALRLKQRRDDDERGAEMVEFAFVVVLLIALLYGIVTFGLILAAQSTITQAAADAARAGLVATSSAITTAESQAGTDVGWMNRGNCGETGTTITCKASEAPCASNSTIQCLTVKVTYNYGASPLFPVLPGLGIITPSTISSTNVVQMASPS